MTFGSIGTLEEPHLYFFLHGMVGMELAPELNIKILREQGPLVESGRTTSGGWPVLRHKGDISELPAVAPALSERPFYKNQLSNPDIQLRPYKALVQFILKERRGPTPTQDKEGRSQPQEILLHKIMGWVGGKRRKVWGEDR